MQPIKKVENVLVFGFDRKTIFVGDYDSALDADKRRLFEYPLLTKTLEMMSEQLFSNSVQCCSEGFFGLDVNHQILRKTIEAVYEKSYPSVEHLGRSLAPAGHMGHVFLCTLWEMTHTPTETFGEETKQYFYTVDAVLEKATDKPQLASDVVIIVKDRDGKVFWVGIERKHEPGVGKIALVGGKQDIVISEDGETSYLEPFSITAMRELSEEVGVIVQYNHLPQDVQPIEKLSNISLSFADCSEKPYALKASSLDFLGLFISGSEEKLKNTYKKRIYWTAGFLLFLDYPDEELICKQIKTKFRALSDAKDIHVEQVELGKVPEFGISHHKEIFLSALLKLRNQERIRV